MAEILVLAEHDGETVKKVTGELLTLARGYGEPAVVWTGDGAEGGRAQKLTPCHFLLLFFHFELHDLAIWQSPR